MPPVSRMSWSIMATIRRQVRTVWISDVHLGFRGCSADFLLRFLEETDCERLYLVGDILDIWAMKKRPHWPQAHNDVVRTILQKATDGTKVVFVPGNHDELLRQYEGMAFGNVSIAERVVHVCEDGRELLVIHGDQFDSVVRNSPLIAKLGSQAYDWLLLVNTYVNAIRRRFGFPYWSLAAFLKYKVKNAVKYVSQFERAVAHAAKRQGVQGVVCGHIHRAEITTLDDILYCNCGDWVESCTALLEGNDGALELYHYNDREESEVVSLRTAA